MRSTSDLIAADRRHVWHPFTQQQGWCEDETPLIIDRAEGTTSSTLDGNAYIDGVSSLWCNVHGHRHPAIDAAIRAPAGPGRPLDDARPRARAGDRARRAAGRDRARRADRVFYSDSGSTAVEIALKMAFQWWAQRGEPERTPVHLPARTPTTGTPSGRSRSAASTCSTRSTARCCSTPCRRGPGDAEHLAALLAEHGEEVAAVIVEPLVQGAAGMLMQPAGLPARGARALRPPRSAAHLRRGRHRVRPDRRDVRLRARGRLPRPACAWARA